MSGQELGAIVIVAGYLGLLIAAIKRFGIGRVLGAVVLFVLLAVAVAFKTIGVMAGRRRY